MWRALLFLWAAALPLHRLGIFDDGQALGHLGAGEWTFALALAGVVGLTGAFGTRRLRDALDAVERDDLVPLAVLAIGFAPSVAVATDHAGAAFRWLELVYIGVLFAVARIATRLGARSELFGGYVAGSLVGVALGWIGSEVDPWLVGGWPRPVGATESPNMMAIECAVALVAVLLGSARGARRIAIVGLFAFTAASTLGHVVFAAVVAALVAAASHAGPRSWARRAFGALAVAGAGLTFLSARVRLLPLSTKPPFVDLGPNLYAAAHTVAGEVFSGAPVFGVGLGGFARAWPAHDDGTRFIDYFPGQEHLAGVPIEPHGTLYASGAEAGLFGIATNLVLVVLAVRARNNVVAGPLERALYDGVLVFAVLASLFANMLHVRELALVLGALTAWSSVKAEAAA